MIIDRGPNQVDWICAGCLPRPVYPHSCQKIVAHVTAPASAPTATHPESNGYGAEHP